jgi:hypothetical protein
MVATTGTSHPTRGRRPLPAEPLLIDQFLPTYDLAIVFSRVFRAPPERCLETVVDSNLFEIPLFRVLIGARGLSQRLVEVVRHRGEESQVPSARPRVRLRDMPSIGWIHLGERPGTELAFGQISTAWKARGGSPDEPVTTATFKDFDQPGFAKLVESTRVDPYGERSSIVTMETRVRCTDAVSRLRFRRYWLAVTPFTHLMRLIALPVLARKAERPR